jgi:hypothetical protein
MLGKWDKYILYFSTGHLSAQIKGVPGRQIDRQTEIWVEKKIARQTDRQTYGQRKGLPDRQTDIWAEKRSARQIDRQAYRQADI